MRQNLVIALATVTSLLVEALTDNGNMAGGILVYQPPVLAPVLLPHPDFG